MFSSLDKEARFSWVVRKDKIKLVGKECLGEEGIAMLIYLVNTGLYIWPNCLPPQF